MLFIKISNLNSGIHKFSFNEKIEDVNLEEPFTGMIDIEIDLQKTNHQVVLDNQFEVGAVFECDRCTREFVQQINTKYEMVYLFGKDAVESESINISYLPLDSDKIEISKDIKEFALLAIPMKKLCSDDCKGLCYRCGKDLNEGYCGCPKEDNDPRWKPLAELKNKLNIKS